MRFHMFFQSFEPKYVHPSPSTPTLPRLLLPRNVHNKSQQSGTLPPCCMCRTASRGGTWSPQLGSQRQAARPPPRTSEGSWMSPAPSAQGEPGFSLSISSTVPLASDASLAATRPPECLSQPSPNWRSGKSSQERSPQPRLERRSERVRGGG